MEIHRTIQKQECHLNGQLVQVFGNQLYLYSVFQHGETQFRMETEGVEVPHFVGNSHLTVAKLDAIVCCWYIKPGPITIEPIVKILSDNTQTELIYINFEGFKLRDCDSIAICENPCHCLRQHMRIVDDDYCSIQLCKI